MQYSMFLSVWKIIKYFINRKYSNERRTRSARLSIYVSSTTWRGYGSQRYRSPIKRLVNRDYREYIDRTANHITKVQDRLADSTLVRKPHTNDSMAARPLHERPFF